MRQLAKKYGLAYNSVRCILLNRDITISNPRKWTRRQEMFLADEYNKGTGTRKISDLIGKSQTSVQRKIIRMIRDGILKKRNK